MHAQASKNAPKGKCNKAKAGSKKPGSGNATFPTSASTNAKARHKGKDKNPKVQPKEVKAKENAKAQEAKASKGKKGKNKKNKKDKKEKAKDKAESKKLQDQHKADKKKKKELEEKRKADQKKQKELQQQKKREADKKKAQDLEKKAEAWNQGQLEQGKKKPKQQPKQSDPPALKPVNGGVHKQKKSKKVKQEARAALTNKENTTPEPKSSLKVETSFKPEFSPEPEIDLSDYGSSPTVEEVRSIPKKHRAQYQAYWDERKRLAVNMKDLVQKLKTLSDRDAHLDARLADMRKGRFAF
ncbi:hypothetical protein DL98DRAFT_530248 [Cadophora sp. DSE1049]|nr:hypothetical protein DL98DRAFT_530248 [Cadophora sp. DSE1049]